MVTLASIRPIRWVLIGVLCLSLLGCGLINPRPPRAVVEGAIAQKLSQTQAVLYRQFAAAATDRTQVSRIRITDHHWTELAGQPAVEVAGTYHLKGGSLTNAQRSQTREFDVYLQRGATKDQWLLLEPVSIKNGEKPKWQAIPLLTAREDEPGNPG
ncbi:MULTISPECIES: hypothetical protein [Cyanophyceae]|uniref:hypothetical protein n=1 Tax=Cyanophyceae TaxID=3028117 RepID=UPI00168449B4|nr:MULTISPECIES: hypothetical protein [Cyanophyceae]MBD1917524.1 hypothetical protein [Phormidium sp. FACHB-77]MBD2029601.1 hypothetical protein [Phormidium sp. FACHB-322]MBD2050862.1 hypothetical protein [Leptolyngbya sp. FACHB-60]